METISQIRFRTIFLDKDPPTDKKIKKLIYWCKRFHKLGLAPKSAGNLSFRTHKKGFIITSTGAQLGTIEKKDFVEVVDVKKGKRKEALVYVKGLGAPSKESLLHSEIYKLRTEINAVFHGHDQLVLEFADKLKISSTEREQPPGSNELVKEVRKLLNSKKEIEYFVLKNHGFISLGKTIDEAGKLAEQNNKTAKLKKERRESDEKNTRV